MNELDDRDTFETPAERQLNYYREKVRGLIYGSDHFYEDCAIVFGEVGPFTRSKGLRIAGRYLIKCAGEIDFTLRELLTKGD